MQTPHVLILTDDSEFALGLTARWRTERHPPSLTVLNSQIWTAPEAENCDLAVIGPVAEGALRRIVPSLPAKLATILCASAQASEIHQLRSGHPRLLHVPLHDDCIPTVVVVAGESLRRTAASREAYQALARAAQSEGDATLGRYMLDMKHNINNALTSLLGNAELLLLEPGQLSAQSLQQIKTMHHMSLRLHEIMQRFSMLASEIREAETTSQAETEETSENVHSRS